MERQGEKSSTYEFTPHVAALARPGPSQPQKPGASSNSSKMYGRNAVIGMLSAAFPYMLAGS